MNKEEIKIMSYLSDNLGHGGSILEMSKGIDSRYGPAYYPNIYNTAKRLEKIGIIGIEAEGNSKLINLNMENPISTYYISETENYKNQGLKLSKELLGDILSLALEFDIFSICSLETDKFQRINRLELLILARNHGSNRDLIKSLRRMESNYGTKIDPIILTIDEFAKIMKSGESDLIKDLILDRNILYNIEGFWEMIKQRKIDARYKRLDKLPQDITRDELAYNYSRLGYQLNENIKHGNRIAIETIIFAMSINNEIRIRYGAIILLYKNIERINWAYLYYIYKRYDSLGKLKGILLSLAHLTDIKHDNEIRDYIDIIQDKPEAYDSRLIKRYAEL
jgi:hypothetical protein